MPLIRNIQRENLLYLGVWDIEEDDAFFEERLQLDGDERVKLLTVHPNRKREWLASRYVLHLISGMEKRAKCIKNEHGQPFLADSKLNISISHSGHLAAVVASPYRVGIDIQRKSPKIERIHSKFIGKDEFSFLEKYEAVEMMHILWGVKEAMYKAWGKRGLDFRRHMFLKEISWDGQRGKGKSMLKKNNIEIHYDMECVFEKDFFLIDVNEKVRIIN